MALSGQLTDVEKTCLFTCAMRSLAKSADPSGRFAPLDVSHDERALRLLLAPPEREALESRAAKRVADAPWFAARGLGLDRLVLQWRARQVVLLGCGMDMRPWRMTWPDNGYTVFEVDTERIIAARQKFAEAVGEPSACVRRTVAADLAEWETVAARLVQAGLDASSPVTWVAEGLLGYLTAPKMLGLLQGTRSLSCQGSVLVATAPPTEGWRSATEASGSKMYHATYEESSLTAQRMREAGWPAVVVVPADTVASACGISQSQHQDLLSASC
eukprot:m51a1_g8488 hypothetical protein (273) ;mRNA; r:549497-550405